MKVGDKVWVFDENSRRYEKTEMGSSRLIYRSHFVEAKIKGETSRSWIIDRWDRKIPKKNFKEGKHSFFISEESISREVWIKDNIMRISDRVRSIKDYNILIQIDEILKD